jgi:hypothetical protein
MELRKVLKYGIITAISLFIAYFLIEFFLYLIEDNLEARRYRIYIYNYTDEDIDIIVNNKTLKTINGKTFVSDNIILDNYNVLSYKININGKIILDKDFKMFDISQSFSARGGIITEVEIHKLDIDDYEIKFLEVNLEDSYIRKIGLKSDIRTQFWDIINRDGLN